MNGSDQSPADLIVSQSERAVLGTHTVVSKEEINDRTQRR